MVDIHGTVLVLMASQVNTIRTLGTGVHSNRAVVLLILLISLDGCMEDIPLEVQAASGTNARCDTGSGGTS